MIDLRKYPRSKDQPNTVAMRTPSRNKKLSKAQVRGFLAYHYPQAKIKKIRIARNYKKGSLAMITADQKLWK